MAKRYTGELTLTYKVQQMTTFVLHKLHGVVTLSQFKVIISRSKGKGKGRYSYSWELHLRAEILTVFPLHLIAHVEVSPRLILKLFGREIIFEEFQPM